MSRKIFIYLWNAVDNFCIKSYTNAGVFIENVLTSESDFMTDDADVMCVDSDNNVYYIPLVAGYYLIRKIDEDGNSLLEKDLGSGVGMIVGICTGSDGYIYGLETGDWGNNNYWITKREKSDLSLVDKVDLGITTDCEGLVCDSDGYLYVFFKTDYSVRKWNMTEQQATRVVTYSRGLSHAGSLVGGIHTQSGNLSAWTIPDALDEDKTIWDLDGISNPKGTSSIVDNFLYVGYYNSDNVILARYNNDKTKVWETVVGTYADNTPYQVASYPFILPPTVTTQAVTEY